MPDVRDSFKKAVQNLKDYIVLVTVDAKKYQETNLQILKFLVSERHTPGVYVTLNKPYDIMRRTMEASGIDTRLIIFIDTVTQLEGGTLRKLDNCLLIGSPEKLSDISVAMDQAINSLPKEKRFLFFDSLNTLAIFNSPAIVARFVHFLTVKMREWKISGVIISLERDIDRKVLDELTQLCDSRLDFGGAG
ncbi:hypothetical protein HYU10_00730 [Candidatus Woesearchaeota archaeon]|nr:hypothetical protein [Candidatus Woesearchaeota archaeon]MBI2130274.1 hypothetical protein [Candidatus Woesearchaeota archaeon]MBI2660775.1 hypothetical protein [Candidatus Woesearchaeota archaeon]